jgi:adenylosuccinate synthase
MGDEEKLMFLLLNMIYSPFQGPNAGHTLEFDGIKHVLRTIHPVFFTKLQTSLETGSN